MTSLFQRSNLKLGKNVLTFPDLFLTFKIKKLNRIFHFLCKESNNLNWLSNFYSFIILHNTSVPDSLNRGQMFRVTN